VVRGESYGGSVTAEAVGSARPYADLVRAGQDGTLPPRNPLLPTPTSETTPKPETQEEAA